MHINYSTRSVGEEDRISIQKKNCESEKSHRRSKCIDCIFLKQLINNPSTISSSLGDIQVILDEYTEAGDGVVSN